MLFRCSSKYDVAVTLDEIRKACANENEDEIEKGFSIRISVNTACLTINQQQAATGYLSQLSGFVSITYGAVLALPARCFTAMGRNCSSRGQRRRPRIAGVLQISSAWPNLYRSAERRSGQPLLSL
eukprot:366389-Chlamydomonas_euryale.AAC.6